MVRAILMLVPCLIPSWRFFQTIEPSPRIEWRRAGGAWRAFRPRPERVTVWQMLARLFWNPAGNEALYLVSLAERIEAGDAPHAVAEVERLILVDLGADMGADLGAVQYRIVFVDAQAQHVVHQGVTGLVCR